MKRANVRGFRIVREPYASLAETPFTVDHFDAAGNLIATLGSYPDLASGRQAFNDAVRHRPQRRLFLRHGAQVVAKHPPD